MRFTAHTTPPRTTAWGAGALAAILSLGASAQISFKEVAPQARGLRVDEHLGAPLPGELEFVNADALKVRLGDFFTHTTPDGTIVSGKPTILAMVYYTCPVVCAVTISSLTDIAREMPSLKAGEDYQILFFSFDPTDDVSATSVRRDIAMSGFPEDRAALARTGIQFHKGETEAARQLSNALGFQYRRNEIDGPERKADAYSHPIVFFLVTADGKIAKYQYGFGHTAQQVRLALLDVGRGVITPSLADRLLTFCYMYDASIGKYTPNVIRIMQLGGVVSLVGVTGLVGVLMYGERARARRRRELAAAGGTETKTTARETTPGGVMA